MHWLRDKELSIGPTVCSVHSLDWLSCDMKQGMVAVFLNQKMNIPYVNNRFTHIHVRIAYIYIVYESIIMGVVFLRTQIISPSNEVGICYDM